MDRLNFSESRYNIGVRQISGSQHTLSLSNFMEVMSRLNIAAKTGPSDLEDVVGSKLIKESDWLSCVIEQDPLMDVMVGLCDLCLFRPPEAKILMRSFQGPTYRMEQYVKYRHLQLYPAEQCILSPDEG